MVCLIKFFLERIHLRLQFYLLFLCGLRSFIKLVHWQADDYAVEEDLIESFYALLHEDLFLELCELLLMAGLEQLVVKPVLEDLILAAQAYEKPAPVLVFALLLLLLHETEEWLGEGPDDKGKDLLKGDHSVKFIVMVAYTII